jgi:two-component system alkaline phosphatase synthesis response regulator PhoP
MINKKILIVEDDKDFSTILQKKFTLEGFTIVTAENGEEAIDVAEKEKPDLIISDVLMPKMDGVTMANKIRETDKNVPIMFLTNLGDDDSIEKPKGFDYLIKSELRIEDIVTKSKIKLGL